MLGEQEEAIAASRRGLQWPNLPDWARTNALSMIVTARAVGGEFDSCPAEAREALAHVRPGDPAGGLALAVSMAALVAYVGGHWSELGWLREAQARVWEDLQQVPGMEYAGPIWFGALSLMAMALARDDHPAVEAAARIAEPALNMPHPHTAARRTVFAAYLADDPARMDLDGLKPIPASNTSWWALTLLTQRGLSAPE